MIVFGPQLLDEGGGIFQALRRLDGVQLPDGVLTHFVSLLVPAEGQGVHGPELAEAGGADAASVLQAAEALRRQERPAAETAEAPFDGF